MTDIVFIVLDGMRKDRLSLYGHERETAPVLSDIASHATTYEKAYTPAPWTLPSHTSMFTGLFPSEHGVTNVFGDQEFGVPDDLDTIAEIAQAEGYRTAGFSNNPWVGQLSGLDRGFEYYVEWDFEISSNGYPDHPTRTERAQSMFHRVLGPAQKQPLALLKHGFFTKRILDRVGRWVTKDDSPSFTFANLMEVHSPWYPPRKSFKELGLKPPNPVSARKLNMSILKQSLQGTQLGENSRERILEYYDSSIRYQDELLGELVETLEAEGRYEDSLLIICSDHGKTLGEFDREAVPSHYIRDVNTNVPLVIKFPSQTTPQTVDSPFELTELYEIIRDQITGASHVTSDGKDTALIQDSVPHTAEETTPVDRYNVLTDGTHKYVELDESETYLLKGRAEQEQIVENDSKCDELSNQLENRLESLSTTTFDEHSSKDIDENVKSQLQDLGYLN